MALSRRGFLRTTLTGSICLGCAAIVGRNLSGYSVAPEIGSQLKALSAKEYLIVQAVARRILAPDGADAPTADSLEIGLFIDGYLARLEAPLRDDVRALLHLVEHGSGPFRL